MEPGLSYLLHATWQLIFETWCQAFFFFSNISVSQLVCEFLQEGIVKVVSLPNSASGISHVCRNANRVNEFKDNMWDKLLKQKLLLRPKMTDTIPE